MARRPTHSKIRGFFMSLAFMGVLMMAVPSVVLRISYIRASGQTSVWMFRSGDKYQLVPVETVNPQEYYGYGQEEKSFDLSASLFFLPPGGDKTGTVYREKKPAGNTPYISIGFYNPEKELKFFMKTNFSTCEYDKCLMTDDPESADAVLFQVAKLTRSVVPTFKRKPGQIWILRTDEAPSRFTWFESLNRTGLREQFNLTLTHKLDSDIPVLYGKLIPEDREIVKDYDAIYERKTKLAAWFVSHCPVRSSRLQYVKKMQSRAQIDVYGKCGTLTCGPGGNMTGVVGMRIQADKEMCFPMLSSTYKFYLSFENSLCQEYISEKFFKLFDNVDVVPVVRGGADYKSYFLADTFVDAADFSTPEALTDYLVDLGNDKDRYISFLARKDRYRAVSDFPDWHCKMCEKLHTDPAPRMYPNVHEWLTRDSCHDPTDSVNLY